jgi:hypothetical protein
MSKGMNVNAFTAYAWLQGRPCQFRAENPKWIRSARFGLEGPLFFRGGTAQASPDLFEDQKLCSVP